MIRRRPSRTYGLRVIILSITLLALGLLPGTPPVRAQENVVIQELTGYLDLGGEAFDRFVAENEISWPEFTLINQKGNQR